MERRVIQEFIEIYRSEPSLWQVRSPHYNNRTIKSAAYRRMVCKLREVQPGADVEAVKRKINALRTNYRKELRKVQKSKEAGGPLYVPSLWYFELFHFIADQESEPPLIDVTGEGVMGVDFEESMTYESDEFDEEFQASSPDSQKHLIQIAPPFPPNNHQPPFKRHRPEGQWFPKPESPPPDGQESFGRYVAAKLREMERSSQVLSERLIAEVLFRGQMGMLSRRTCLSDEGPPTIKVEDSPSQ